MKEFEFESMVERHADLCKRNRRAARYVQHNTEQRDIRQSVVKTIVLTIIILVAVVSGTIFTTVKVKGLLDRQPREIHVPEGHNIVYHEYVVARGDTLEGIASLNTQTEYFRTNDLVVEIMSLNDIPNPDYIRTGDIIKIPQIK